MLDLNWRDPPSLPSPRRAVAKAVSLARDKAALAKPSKGRKKHSTNRERSREAAAKAAKHVDNAIGAKAQRRRWLAQAQRRRWLAQAQRRRWLAQARAYWRGEVAEHPV